MIDCSFWTSFKNPIYVNMAKAKRTTRQATKAMNDSLNLYNFETSDECIKLSFSPDKSMNSSMCGHRTKGRSKEKPFNRQINSIKQSTKKSIGHVMKSPSFEFFSKKLGRTRKSDSGVFMTPSPILKNTSKSIHQTPSKEIAAKKNHKSGIFSDKFVDSEKSQSSKQESKAVTKSQRKSIRTSKMSKVKGEESLMTKEKVKVTKKEQTGNLNIVKQVKEQRLKLNKSEKPKTKTSKVENKKDGLFLIPKIEKKQKDNTSAGARVQKAFVRSTRPTASSKLKRNQKIGLRKSTHCGQRSLKQSTLSFASHKSISKKHNKHHNNVLIGPTSTPNVMLKPNRKTLMGSSQNSLSPPKVSPVLKLISPGGVVHGEVITSPTDLGSPQLKRMTRQSLSAKKQAGSPMLKINKSSEKVQPVQDNSGSPQLKRTTRQSTTKQQTASAILERSKSSEKITSTSPVLAMSKLVYTSKLKSTHSNGGKMTRRDTKLKEGKENDIFSKNYSSKNNSSKIKNHQKSNGQNTDSFKKRNNTSENKPSKSALSSHTGGKKRKSQDSSTDSDIPTNKKVKGINEEEEEQIKLSMSLFEDYSPIKVTRPKKKSPPKQTAGVILDNDEANCSILDISKTYNPNSFSQYTGSFTKKQKGRYSTSKIELWAQQKNEEFNEFEDYELSME